jgi:hypothetical protein
MKLGIVRTGRVTTTLAGAWSKTRKVVPSPGGSHG